MINIPDQFNKIEADAQTSAFGDNSKPIPSDAQCHAGNYKLGKTVVQGVPVHIENPRGSYRTGKDSNGKAWSCRLSAHYGFFPGTLGNDGDPVDCFVGPFPLAESAYVINQHVNGVWDEHKVMLGCVDADNAKQTYLNSFAHGWDGLHSIVKTTIPQLKHWLKNGDTKRPLLPENLPTAGYETMKNKVTWDDANNPVGMDLDKLTYDIRRADAEEGLLLDSVTMAEIYEGAESREVFDALVTPFNKLQRKMDILMRVMTQQGGEIKPLSVQISDPFKAAGTAQVATVFELSDGQTISIFFHNPDVTPQKILPTDELVSWKWLLNKKDITIIVAPEKGEDLNVRTIAVRIMKIADKNSAAFQRSNANRAAKMEAISALRDVEIPALEKELETAQHELEIAKIEQDDRQLKDDESRRGIGLDPTNPVDYARIIDNIFMLKDYAKDLDNFFNTRIDEIFKSLKNLGWYDSRKGEMAKGDVIATFDLNNFGIDRDTVGLKVVFIDRTTDMDMAQDIVDTLEDTAEGFAAKIDAVANAFNATNTPVIEPELHLLPTTDFKIDIPSLLLAFPALKSCGLTSAIINIHGEVMMVSDWGNDPSVTGVTDDEILQAWRDGDLLEYNSDVDREDQLDGDRRELTKFRENHQFQTPDAIAEGEAYDIDNEDLIALEESAFLVDKSVKANGGLIAWGNYDASAHNASVFDDGTSDPGYKAINQEVMDGGCKLDSEDVPPTDAGAAPDENAGGDEEVTQMIMDGGEKDSNALDSETVTTPVVAEGEAPANETAGGVEEVTQTILAQKPVLDSETVPPTDAGSAPDENAGGDEEVTQMIMDAAKTNVAGDYEDDQGGKGNSSVVIRGQDNDELASDGEAEAILDAANLGTHLNADGLNEANHGKPLTTTHINANGQIRFDASDKKGSAKKDAIIAMTENGRLTGDITWDAFKKVLNIDDSMTLEQALSMKNADNVLAKNPVVYVNKATFDAATGPTKSAPKGWVKARESSWDAFNPHGNKPVTPVFDMDIRVKGKPTYDLCILWDGENYIPCHGSVVMPDRVKTAKAAAKIAQDWYTKETGLTLDSATYDEVVKPGSIIGQIANSAGVVVARVKIGYEGEVTIYRGGNGDNAIAADISDVGQINDAIKTAFEGAPEVIEIKEVSYSPSPDVQILQDIVAGKFDTYDLNDLLDKIDGCASALTEAGFGEEYDALIGDAAEKWAALDEKANG